MTADFILAEFFRGGFMILNVYIRMDLLLKKLRKIKLDHRFGDRF